MSAERILLIHKNKKAPRKPYNIEVASMHFLLGLLVSNIDHSKNSSLQQRIINSRAGVSGARERTGPEATRGRKLITTYD